MKELVTNKNANNNNKTHLNDANKNKPISKEFSLVVKKKVNEI